MNYGLYLSAAGALSQLHRQDVHAANLANLNTVGFKPDMVAARQRLPERIEDPDGFVDPQLMLEKLGGGLLLNPTQISLAQGNLTQTGNDLDLAIQGDGLFAVSDGQGTGPEHTRYTRDGRFVLNSQGELVMAVNGKRVLDANDQVIQLDRSAPVSIDANGAISQNGRTVAQLRLVAAPAGDHLRKVGENLLQLTSGARIPDAAPTGRVQQGFVEAAAVDPITTMTAMLAATRGVSANTKMMQYHDQTLGQAFNTFGRVA
jgi:flagellar basal body rod protein FlgG